METQIIQLISQSQDIPAEKIRLEKLHGEASNRIYYRAHFGNSLIVMKLPDGASSVSEEITSGQKPQELPFLTIAGYLNELKLPVPKIILDASQKEKIILLEDLGDQTFEKQYLDASNNEKLKLYQKAIELLLEFQKKSSASKTRCIAHDRSFDAFLLNWEFDHFIEYGIEVRLNIVIPEKDKKRLIEETRKITDILVTLPQTLVHRDFQSRNLMVHQEHLYILDFQDALMGPLPYDLVGLLRDSYIALPHHDLAELSRFYVIKREELGLETPSLDEFHRWFDLMTIQRKLKDAGRFVYIDRVKKNPSFLQHIPNSLQYVKEALEKTFEAKELFKILKPFVPEFF